MATQGDRLFFHSVSFIEYFCSQQYAEFVEINIRHGHNLEEKDTCVYECVCVVVITTLLVQAKYFGNTEEVINFCGNEAGVGETLVSLRWILNNKVSFEVEKIESV